jgi:hypothetical protein
MQQGNDKLYWNDVLTHLIGMAWAHYTVKSDGLIVSQFIKWSSRSYVEVSGHDLF